MANGSVQVVGKGEVALAALLVLGALLACGATEAQLKTRAAFDLNCPAAQLTFVVLDGETTGVTGCGQRATYVQRCDGPPGSMRSCTWVLNAAFDRPSSLAASSAAPSNPAPSNAAPSSAAPSNAAPSSAASSNTAPSSAEPSSSPFGGR